MAERIEDVRKLTPPPPGRQARRGYASKEDFAAIVGVSRSRIYAWTRATSPGYPEERYQERLAELSGGRYEPGDFGRPGVQRALPEGVEAEVLRLARDVRRLTRRVQALERRARPSTGEAGME